MPDPRDTGPPGVPAEVPPDVPPEHAEAYRRGFERAYEQQTGHPREETGPLGVVMGPRGPEEDRRRLRAPLVLVALAVVLVLAAYGLGRVFADHLGDGTSAQAQPDGSVLGSSPSGEPQSADRGSDRATQAQAYGGKVGAAPVADAEVSCQASDGVDAAGHTVSYAPAKMHDDDPSTAWRCDGDGVGETVTLRLHGRRTLGKVGLVPGYAKTDQRSGADRYAQNNRITRVRWGFDDGSSVVQRLNGSADHRALQTVRIPRTTTASVRLTLLASRHGPRNTVAISEVFLGRVR